MSARAQNILSIVLVAALLLLNCLPAYSQGKSMRATGPFEVKITPQASNEAGDGMSMGRNSVEKQFHGDLEATSKAEMLTGMTAVKGSAAYVAIERITGTLKGKSGSFMMQHSGTMTRGAPSLSVTVIPDSGTGELAGIAGKMGVVIAPDGKHSYEFEYTLP
jgi:uncharacterized protein DUF3224